MRLSITWLAATVPLLLGSFGGNLYSQTRVDLRTQTKSVDFSGAESTKPVKSGATLPATCTMGDMFYKTDGIPGKNLLACTASNSWSAVGVSNSSEIGVDRASGTVLSIGTACLPSTPCNIRFGAQTYTFTAPLTATITAGSGSGLARIYVNQTGTVLLLHSAAAGLTVNCAGCISQQSVTPVIPPGSIPLADVTITSGSWTTVTDRRAYLADKVVVAGSGIVVQEVSGITEIAIDSADAARQGGTNTFTGDNTFAAATSTIPAKTGTVLPGACAVGELYFKSDATAGQNLYQCQSPNIWTQQLNNSNPLDYTTVQLAEEFLPSPAFSGQSPVFNKYDIVGTGTTLSSNIVSPGSHPGVFRLSTSNTIGDATGMRVIDGSLGSIGAVLLGPTGDFTGWDAQFIIRPNTSITDSGFFAGFSTAADGQFAFGASDLIGVFYDSVLHNCSSGTSSAANLVYSVRASGNDSCQNSTVPVTASTWYRIHLSSTTPGQVTFKVSINGGSYSSPVTLSTNVPTTILSPVFQVITRTTERRDLDIDRFAFLGSGVSR